MGKQIETKHEAIFRCPKCDHQTTVRLVLHASDDAIDCAACGNRVGTMQGLIELVTRQVAERFKQGLARTWTGRRQPWC